MKPAVIYARVSSKDQEREGYSIPAQLKMLHEYARINDFTISHEFVDVETAKMAGRKQFGEMVRFFEKTPGCRVVIAEKTDRLYRNLRDSLTLEDLNIEIHLPKEGQVISKGAKSQDKLIHGIHVVMARNYIENLREEVTKGMREKAEQGIYPSRPPLGYLNNKLERTIEINPQKAPVARRMFELYASGRHSVSSVRSVIRDEFGLTLGKGYLDRMLKNPFYEGHFRWAGKLYSGTHTPLVSTELFEQVQTVFRGYNRPTYRSHDFAYRGLLSCAYDNCTVTAEIKKEKYTYYHCTGGRGKCKLPYFRENELGDRLGGVLKNIQVPDAILAQLQNSLLNDQGHAEEITKQQRERNAQRLSQVHRRMDQAYTDKVDGKISEEFWIRKSKEWESEESQIQASNQGLEAITPQRFLDAARTLELANKAYSLYFKQDHSERAKLLKMVLSHCAIDTVSLYPTYTKPFDLIFEKVKTKEWCARGDSNSRPSGS